MAVGWSPAGRTGLTLEAGDLGALGGYRNCPVLGTAFPQLETLDSRGRSIVARIPPGDLFDRAVGKHIVIGQAARTVRDGTSSWTTRIRFVVSLTAVGR